MAAAQIGAPLGLSFHANYLTQCMQDLNEIRLGGHNGLNRFVSGRSFIDHVSVFATLDAFRHPDVVFHRELLLGFITGHGASRPMAATVETFRVALATHAVRPRAHASGDNPEVALASAHGSLAGD